MTTLKQETIEALENLLETKALCNNSDKYDLEKPSIVFELDEDDNEKIVFEKNDILYVSFSLETSIERYKIVFSVLELLEKYEDVSNLSILTDYSEYEKELISGESEEVPFYLTENLYNAIRIKMEEIAAKQTNSKLVFQGLIEFTISSNANYKGSDVNEMKFLLNSLGYSYKMYLSSNTVEFELSFVSSSLIISLHSDGKTVVSHGTKEKLTFDSIPEASILSNAINQLVFKV